MTIHYVLAAGRAGIPDPGNVNGFPQVQAGTIVARPGDVFIIDGGVNSGIIFTSATPGIATPV